MISISELRSEQQPLVKEMLREYVDWAFSFMKESAQAPTFKDVEREMEEFPGPFTPPTGRFLVAEMNGIPIGFVALQRVDDRVGEVKRLYVTPAGRGQKIGSLLVARLIEEAREIGYEELILDSHGSMQSAHKVYRNAGFMDCGAPEGFPAWLAPRVVFMKMSLE